MSLYTTHVSIHPFPLDDGHWAWCLTEPLHWELSHQGSGWWVVVPAGFVTDLASIPRWGQWLLNPYAPEMAKAAVIHDWMLPNPYEAAAGLPQYANRPLFEPRVAAGEFYAAMKADGVPLWRRWLCYVAVVIGIAEW